MHNLCTAYSGCVWSRLGYQRINRNEGMGIGFMVVCNGLLCGLD